MTLFKLVNFEKRQKTEEWKKDLENTGFSILKLDDYIAFDVPRFKKEVVELIEELGEVCPISGKVAYDHYVSLDVKPDRTHGTGTNLLHIDYMSHDTPPRYIALACVRQDPFGGGESTISNIEEAKSQLTDSEIKLLEQPVFSYYTDDDGLELFGENVSPFPVFDGANTRFTGKAIESESFFKDKIDDNYKDQFFDLFNAYAKFSKILHENKIAYRLKEGEVLIFDQTKMVHGRNALGAQQNLLNSNNRRLLFQIYGTDTK